MAKRTNRWITLLLTVALAQAHFQAFAPEDDGGAIGLAGYKDADSVSDRAYAAMAWAVRAGLINGADGRLDPQGGAPRAQLAMLMQRYCEMAEK